MTTPPRLATWILERSLAKFERDAIVGDLHEEYCGHVAPARGAWRARWWYRRQVARSLAPLLFRSWQRASLRRASTAIVCGAFVSVAPVVALLTLRTFVLQQVPLKTTAELSWTFATVLAGVVLAAVALGSAAAIRLLTADSREG